MPDLEVRTVDLELRFMKLERELAELSEVVASQQRTIDALRAEALRRRGRDAEGDAHHPGHPETAGAEVGGSSREDRLRDDKPPHY
ncbi:MAG TPA: SlyX family protein [Polyangiaceae bacterium]|jgi:uncharacterized coiled-coil protein SlyX|nr:SlyX family protein [Polyangiaceae bacterium]